MNTILAPVEQQHAMIYIKDVVFFSKSLEEDEHQIKSAL